MAETHDVLLPDIGDFENVDVAEVLVAVGDRVAVEQSLIVLESDKASMEIPSPFAGVIVELNTFATAAELEYLLETSAVSALLYERHVAGKDFTALLAGLDRARFPCLSHLAVIDDSGEPPGGATLAWRDFLERGSAAPKAVVFTAAA